MAIPHAYIKGIDRPLVYFVRLARPVNLDAPDGIPTRFLFLLLGPPEATAGHLETLASIGRLSGDPLESTWRPPRHLPGTCPDTDKTVAGT